MADGSHSLALPFDEELVVDLFAGGGGASRGLAEAYREPDVAVNHDPIAIAVHRANHPHTEHFECDVFEVDPVLATRGRPVGVLWASPDCRHHSKASGGKPRSKRVRGLAWVVTKWAALTRPRIIHLENVEEFADWGPLVNERPCKARKGLTFRRWVRKLQRLGYAVEWRELIAADYGAPTIRKRLYVIARCDGRPIAWPAPTHSKKGGALPTWRAAAECIDFSIEARSIFDRPRPLKPNTFRRVARGAGRFVINNPKPFIVPFRGSSPAHHSTHSIDNPLSVVSAGGTHHGLVAPVLTEFANASTQRTWTPTEPLRTQMAQVKGGHFAVAAAHLTAFGENAIGSDLDDPSQTALAGATRFGLASAHLMHMTHHGGDRSTSIDDPARTVTAANRGEQALVSAVMIQAAHGEGRPGGVQRWGIGSKSADDPLGTTTASGSGGHAVMCAWMEQANTGRIGHPMPSPVSTITQRGTQQRVVTAYMVKFYSQGGQWQGCAEPMHTTTTKARMGLVEVIHVPGDALAPDTLAKARKCAAFLHEYLPEQFPELVDMIMLDGWIIVDFTLRMLTPRELARAQGFPESYILDRGLFETFKGSGVYVWKPVTKTDQVRLIGNSVCPDVAKAIAMANTVELRAVYRHEMGLAA